MNDDRYELLMESVIFIANSLAVLLKKSGEQEMAEMLHEHAEIVNTYIEKWKLPKH